MRSPGAILVLSCLLAAVGAGSGVQERSPNIVVIFLDDAGYGDFGYTGNPVIRTPNIDRMAAEGMRFTQFYSASPACTASRYSLLTGRLPLRSGFSWVLVPDSPRGMHPTELTLAEALRNAGYATAIYGKWHLGTPREYLPLQHGFDEYFGLPYSNDMRPPKWPSLPLYEGNEVIEVDTDQSTLTARYTERAVDFIDRHRGRPFFLYVPHAMPHLPLYASESFAGRSERGLYGDVIEELDWSVGQILDALRDRDLAERTLVFFTSDNGPWIIKNEEGGDSGPFRDGKGSTWEGGVREPAIAWWPGTVAAGSIDRQVASTMDLLPTALTLSNQALPADRTIDGHDLGARLRGTARAPSDPAPLFLYGPRELHAVRVGPWKLHLRTSSQTGIDYFGELPLLFHLEEDPGENWNRAPDHPELVAELTQLADEHLEALAREGTFFDREP